MYGLINFRVAKLTKRHVLVQIYWAEKLHKKFTNIVMC